MTVLSFTTTARQGNARAPGVLAKLLKTKNLPTSFACAEQVHGHKIIVVPPLKATTKYDGADGLLTDQPNQPLVIFTADCVPVFIADQKNRVVGVLHAGWRGVRAGILPKAIGLIRRKWGIPAKELHVWFGPSIGRCCFEVQWDVARNFPGSRRRGKHGWMVNLAEELQRQVRNRGARFVNKDSSTHCTRHEKGFHSFRRDKTPQRMASVIIRKNGVGKG